MYCSKCGAFLSDSVRFCGACGAAQLPVPPAAGMVVPQSPHPGSTMGLVGFSARISDPAFDKYRKNSKRWALLFSLILFVAACIGFPIYGNASGEIDFPRSLYYGMGIGGMFVVIALIQTIRQGRDRTWDGTVTDKTAVRKTRQDNDGSGHQHYMEYTVVVRRDDGRTKRHRSTNTPGLYNYLRTGERVRHHKGFYVYEKYDKSQDAEIMCVACGKMNSVLADTCERCKCPVLKG